MQGRRYGPDTGVRGSVDLSTVLEFHQKWFYVSVISCGVVGIWGVVLAIAKREPSRWFGIARGVAIAAILIQVAAGIYLYSNGIHPSNAMHMFYGVVITITLTLAYLYRSTMAKKPGLTYGILLLFVMGLGLRAWMNTG